VRRRLLAGFVLFALVVLLAFEIPLAITWTRRERDQFLGTVRREATTFAVIGEEHLEDPGTADLQSLADRFSAGTGTEIAVLDRNGGTIVATGRPPVASGSAVIDADVLAKAQPGKILELTDQLRDGGPVQQVAIVPITTDSTIRGFALAARARSGLDDRLATIRITLAALGAAALALAALMGVLFARSISRPLADLAATAHALGEGDLGARAPTGSGPAELRELSTTVNDMAERIEQLVGAQRAFVADASHQLRTPLTALRLRLDALEDEVAPQSRADYDKVVAEASRLARLVDGLLALARAEAQQPERRPIDVWDVLGERVDTWSALADERGVELTLARAGPGRTVAELVPGHLEQILDNLIANSLDAMPEGGAIEVHLGTGGERVAVTVADEGPGLTVEECRHAFDRFWRGRASASELGGSGLGLAIVRELVRANHGSVELRPRSPHGLEAELELEAAPPL